ncbi:MAG: hypothetical protein AAFX81_00890 [Pseudomonadota bacterium]
MQVSALVVFTDQRQSTWLRWLRSGYRHCFVVVRDPAGEWLACDWLCGRLEFHVYGPQQPTALIDAFVARGHRVVAVVKLRRRGRRSPFRLMSCVEIVKQAIGVGGWRPITPHGLFVALRDAGHHTFEP